MSWRDERENKKYMIPIGRGRANRIRVRILVEQGVVLRFTVRYEPVVDGEVYPVVRDDTAHAYAHRDVLDGDGPDVEKPELARPERCNQAVTEAIADVKANWPTYLTEFLERKP